MSGISKFIEKEGTSEASKGWGRGKWGVSYRVTEFLFGVMETFWK